MKFYLCTHHPHQNPEHFRSPRKFPPARFSQYPGFCHHRLALPGFETQHKVDGKIHNQFFFNYFLKIWNASRICVSSLCGGHANLYRSGFSVCAAQASMTAGFCLYAQRALGCAQALQYLNCTHKHLEPPDSRLSHTPAPSPWETHSRGYRQGHTCHGDVHAC